MAKRGRRRQDHYSRRAQAAGYQARSVYKLEELQKKFHLVKPGDRVLDLGAAPGSWTQRLLELVGSEGQVVACDLQEIALSGKDRLHIVRGDFTDPEIIQELERLGPYDLVVSDAAPATTGNRTVDTARSEGLVESALDLARRFLTPSGNCAVKLFQGGAEQRLRADMQELYRKVAQTKPDASRKESFEVYLVGLGLQKPPEGEEAHG